MHDPLNGKGRERLETFITHLQQQGWDAKKKEQEVRLPERIKERYTNIPKSWFDFISEVYSFVNSSETSWFLCEEDYEIQGDKAFQWNEWELLSLKCAEGDTDWENEIKDFWDSHFPILMSVKGSYSYYAISMIDGSIVQGSEPEFEECEKIADSFWEFMQKISKNELRV